MTFHAAIVAIMMAQFVLLIVINSGMVREKESSLTIIVSLLSVLIAIVALTKVQP